MNPVHSITPLIHKGIDMILIANYYEFLTILTIERGTKFQKVYRKALTKQEFHGGISVNHKKPEFMMIGNGLLSIIEIVI